MDLRIFKQPQTIFFLTLFLVLLIWDVFLQLSPNKTTSWHYLYNLGYGFVLFCGSIIGFRGVKSVSLKSTIGKALLFFSLALASYAIGQSIWAYYNLISLVETPYPSLADLFFVIFIPCIGIAVIYINNMFLTSITKRLVIESLLIPFIPGFIILAFLNRPDLSTHLSLLTKFFNLAYPVGDVILIWLALLIMRIAGGRIYTGTLFLICGLFAQAGADLLFAYRTTAHLYWNGDISDLLFATSSILLSLSIVALLSDFMSPNNESIPTASAETAITP